MGITFLGGTETVTGSKYLLESGATRILVDCGLFQGYKWLRERNWQPLPLDIGKLDAVVLTHAHLDHSGYIPVLYQHGYLKPVFPHAATKALCGILLPDSGHIREEDARIYARHKLGKHATPEPLYDRPTAEHCLELFEPVGFGEAFSIGNIRLHVQAAGHILGAGSLIAEAEGKRVGFSGDVGRPDDVLMKPPEPLPELDLVLLESTYGNRRHAEMDQLATIVNETAQNGGALLIPSFAVGSAQALQHPLATLKRASRIPDLPVYLDSPMAISVADIYCQYSSQHRLSHDQCHHMCELAIYYAQRGGVEGAGRVSFPVHHHRRQRHGHRRADPASLQAAVEGSSHHGAVHRFSGRRHPQCEDAVRGGQREDSRRVASRQGAHRGDPWSVGACGLCGDAALAGTLAADGRHGHQAGARRAGGPARSSAAHKPLQRRHGQLSKCLDRVAVHALNQSRRLACEQ